MPRNPRIITKAISTARKTAASAAKKLKLIKTAAGNGAKHTLRTLRNKNLELNELKLTSRQMTEARNQTHAYIKQGKNGFYLEIHSDVPETMRYETTLKEFIPELSHGTVSSGKIHFWRNGVIREATIRTNIVERKNNKTVIFKLTFSTKGKLLKRERTELS